MFRSRLRSFNATRAKTTRGVSFQNNAGGQLSSSGSMQSHLLAGLAGGATVALAGYGYYHFSGTKKVIDNAKAFKASMIQAKDRLAERVPEPCAILRYLRSTAKAYTDFVPGTANYVDATFDSIEELSDTHSEEFNGILIGAYEELRPVLQNGSLDQETAVKVFSIIRKRTLELQDLSARAGSDFLGPLFEKHPEMKEKLGSCYERVINLAPQSGPEATHIIKKTSAKLKDVFKGGIDDNSINNAKRILQETAERLQKATGEADAKEAWQKSLQNVRPYLDKLPDVKDLLDNKALVLMNGAGATQIWDRIKEIGQQKKVSKEKVEELKNFINEKAGEAGDYSEDLWDKVLECSKGIPGWERLDEKRQLLKGFVDVVRDGGENARALAKETFEDVMNVIEQKAEKAKSLKEKAKDGAQDATIKRKSGKCKEQ